MMKIAAPGHRQAQEESSAGLVHAGAPLGRRIRADEAPSHDRKPPVLRHQPMVSICQRRSAQGGAPCLQRRAQSPRRCEPRAALPDRVRQRPALPVRAPYRPMCRHGVYGRLDDEGRDASVASASPLLLTTEKRTTEVPHACESAAPSSGTWAPGRASAAWPRQAWPVQSVRRVRLLPTPHARGECCSVLAVPRRTMDRRAAAPGQDPTAGTAVVAASVGGIGVAARPACRRRQLCALGTSRVRRLGLWLSAAALVLCAVLVPGTWSPFASQLSFTRSFPGGNAV